MRKHRSGGVLLLTVLLSAVLIQTAWAGEWVLRDSGEWFYEENGESVTGWQKINGRWYLLDEETGAWKEKPEVTPENACYLLENKLAEQGLYQDEEEEIFCRVEYVTKEMIKVSVGYEDRPGYFRAVNIYEINRKTGITDPVIGDKKFSIW
ncbi:MAG: hypothetical protein ACI4F3_03830 [Enterocloster sp.]